MLDINTEQLHNVPSSRIERHIQKKAARETKALRTRRKRIFKKGSYWVAGVVIVIGGGWLFVSVTGPKGTDYSQRISVLGRDHISNGITSTSYNSNPPTSGPHYENPAQTRFYDKELPDEQLVHNLEHGHIWISYKPNLSEEVIKALRKLSGGNIIATPRSKNDSDVAVAAWGRLDTFNIEVSGIDTQRIKDFISRYQNKGPERVNVQNHLR